MFILQVTYCVTETLVSVRTCSVTCCARSLTLHQAVCRLLDLQFSQGSE